MEPAEAGASCQRFERKRFVGVRLDVPAQFLNGAESRSNRAFRVAALAGAEPVLFGRVRSFVEAHILAQRPAGGARWPAIHTGREYSDQEFPILTAVPVADSLPTLFC